MRTLPWQSEFKVISRVLDTLSGQLIKLDDTLSASKFQSITV